MVGKEVGGNCRHQHPHLDHATPVEHFTGAREARGGIWPPGGPVRAERAARSAELLSYTQEVAARSAICTVFPFESRLLLAGWNPIGRTEKAGRRV